MKAPERFKLRLLVLSALLATCMTEVRGVDSAPSNVTMSRKGADYERSVLARLLPVLKSADRAARIYYAATCPPDEEHYPLAFQRVSVRSPIKHQTVVATVRSIFRAEPLAAVTEDSTGMIRIRVGNPPVAILRTRLGTLHLTPDEQYNPLLAIFAIENAPGVKSAMSKLGLQIPVRPLDLPSVNPAAGLPHLPSEMSNMTMDQALDLVASTWAAALLYGACTSSGTYEISVEGVNFRLGPVSPPGT